MLHTPLSLMSVDCTFSSSASSHKIITPQSIHPHPKRSKVMTKWRQGVASEIIISFPYKKKKMAKKEVKKEEIRKKKRKLLKEKQEQKKNATVTVRKRKVNVKKEDVQARKSERIRKQVTTCLFENNSNVEEGTTKASSLLLRLRQRYSSLQILPWTLQRVVFQWILDTVPRASCLKWAHCLCTGVKSHTASLVCELCRWLVFVVWLVYVCALRNYDYKRSS